MKKIRGDIKDGVAVIELNDPPANTYSYEMMQEIDRAVLAARMDANVHVIVLIGAGDKFFCAGANIGMLAVAKIDRSFVSTQLFYVVSNMDFLPVYLVSFLIADCARKLKGSNASENLTTCTGFSRYFQWR